MVCGLIVDISTPQNKVLSDKVIFYGLTVLFIINQFHQMLPVRVTKDSANAALRAQGTVKMRIMNPSVKTTVLMVATVPAVSFPFEFIFSLYLKLLL